MLERHAASVIEEALADTPVVLLNGARQTGKSTLAREISTRYPGARFLNFDDAATLAAARESPTQFFQGSDALTVIDEVQHGVDLFRVLKAEIDRDRRPGRFLLTGSANVLLLPRMSDSLAGRMQIVTLGPLTQGEMHGGPDRLIDSLFAGSLRGHWQTALTRDDIFARIFAGAYPELLTRTTARRQSAWYESYINTLLSRDVRDLANIEHLVMMPRILTALASRAAQLMNVAELSRTLKLPATTLERYLHILEALFLVERLLPWTPMESAKRLARSPKLMFSDTGMMAHLLHASELSALNDIQAGSLLENFVYGELRRQREWSEARPSFSHFRTHRGEEIDIVMERGTKLVGVEVKASGSVQAADFKSLNSLRETVRERFVAGVVLYTGQQLYRFGERLWAMPIAALWEYE